MMLEYKLEQNSNTETTLFLKGNILGGADNFEEIDSSLQSQIEENIQVCVINLKEVEYMDSGGLGLLLKLLTKFRNVGGEVYLEEVSESVKKLLLITKLNSIFEIK